MRGWGGGKPCNETDTNVSIPMVTHSTSAAVPGSTLPPPNLPSIHSAMAGHLEQESDALDALEATWHPHVLCAPNTWLPSADCPAVSQCLRCP